MLKTLIVFDTNVLRSTEAGRVAYSFFSFGKPFQLIEEYINSNHLSEYINLAVPAWAIEELKDQKNRQYLDDLEKYTEVTQRLSGLPNFQGMPPQEEFNCDLYILEKADEYLATKQVKKLEIKEELASAVLKSMMRRVLKEEKLKKPFSQSGKYNDAGFKDNIIWESLMHYEDVEAYDKFIFITKDTDYGNCQTEFKEKWNKHIVTLKDENSVTAEILKDYGLYINERVICDFAQTDYFRDYLCDCLKAKTEICFAEANFRIEDFEIIDTCTNIERMPPTEDLEENLIIHSNIRIYFSENRDKKEQIVVAKTTLADDETKDIVETTFETELI